MSVNRRRFSSSSARVLWTLAALCLVPAASLPAVGSQPDKVTIRSDGRERQYYLLVPPSVPSGMPAPVLLLLHGSYSTPLDILPAWSELAAREGIILAAPKSWAEYGWRIREDGPQLLRDVIDDIALEHMINRRRLYIFGFSAGAVHALTLGLLESQYFAAVAIHAGAWTDRSSFHVIPLVRRKIPVWITIGDQDEQFPLPSVRATEEALQSAGLPVTVTIMKGRRHSYSDVAPRVNPDAWAFLQPLQLDEPPVFLSYR